MLTKGFIGKVLWVLLDGLLKELVGLLGKLGLAVMSPVLGLLWLNFGVNFVFWLYPEAFPVFLLNAELFPVF